MADYWISNPRKQCDFCKCWIADNKASIGFHEKGKNHQENVKRRLAEVKKKATVKRKQDEFFTKEFAAMEAAALKAVQQDLKNDPTILGANDLSTLVKDSNETHDEKTATKTEIGQTATKTETGQASGKTWTTCQAPQGHTYYYNQQTGESRWDKPPELAQKDDAEESNDKTTLVEESISSKTELSNRNQQKLDDTNDDETSSSTHETEVHPLLGGWTVVEHQTESEPSAETSMEADERVTEEGSETSPKKDTTDPESLTKDSRKRTAVFKEKKIRSLNTIDTSESVGFKKRKVNNTRMSRRRNDDDS